MNDKIFTLRKSEKQQGFVCAGLNTIDDKCWSGVSGGLQEEGVG